ncbi:MAG: hypothetical protein ABIF82_00595 [Planctomycetota bacterium]
MYLRKHAITVTTTTATTGTFSTTLALSGRVYAVEHIRGATPLSSTAAIVLKTGTNSITIVSGLTATTGNWMYLPRIKERTSTGVIATAGMFPIGGEKISAVVSNTTAASQGGTINVYEEGV